MKILNSSEFDNAIASGVVLVDFYADWCGPCKMLSPLLEEINSEDENIKIVKVNVDNSQFLANYFDIKSIPTLVLLKDGQFIHRLTGFRPKSVIKKLISQGK
mgnify:CR=1 FL=1